MSERTLIPIEGEDYQEIAEKSRELVSKLIFGIHQINCHKLGTNDAGPVINGALTAIIEFLMVNGYDEAVVRQSFDLVLDTIPQQLALALAAERAGTATSGTA